MSRCKRSLLKRLGALSLRTESVGGEKRRKPNGPTQENRPRAGLLNPGQRLPETSPVECRPGVGLAAGCDVDVPDDIDDRIAPAQNHEKFRQTRVLPVGVGLVVGAFELHADGEVVTALASPPAGRARVPGSLRARHQLDQFAPAPYEKMR